MMPMFNITLNLVVDTAQLGRIEAALAVLNLKGTTIMVTTQDILDKVTEQTTITAGLVAAIDGLEQQVNDALAGVTLPPAVQAKIDEAFAALSANNVTLAAALVDATDGTTT